jgi:hypothetical protein
MHIGRSALDATSGVNQARPNLPLEGLVALIARSFGEAPHGRKEWREWERQSIQM